MRAAVVTLAVVASGLFASDRPAAAQVFQHYAFCLYTGGAEGGFERCTYTNFQQCLEDRRGDGGICYTNPAYAPQAAQPRRRTRQG
jgi:hypothetical protein